MLFGTDGVRGVVDKEINHNTCYDIGKGLAIYLIDNNLEKKVIVGGDTRLSTDCYISSIASGLLDYGVNVDIVGVVSTPIISFLVNRMKYSAGIMITASHNDFTYNGTKVFNCYGEKADMIMERDIEHNISKTIKIIKKGKITFNNNLANKYEDYLYKKFVDKITNLKIVLDCANGANYEIAPRVLKKLGVTVIEKDCNNDGRKINENCGANHIDNLGQYIKENNADFGIAFDGDGDRLRVVLKDGKILDGDDLLYIFATNIQENTNYKLDRICGTIMTNRGLDKSLENKNIKVERSSVGDKNLIALMKKNSIILGGESSGHICFLYYLPSCDALYNAIYFLKCYSVWGERIYKIINEKITFNSKTSNIKVDEVFRKNFDTNIILKNKINKICAEYNDAKIIVRPSGTEPVIRIYVESIDNKNNDKILQKIQDIIKSEQLL
jgi:phosphoglucosamine mutase